MPATPTTDRLPFTGDDEADRYLVSEPLALLIGFALDQQVTVQTAFLGPLKLERRLGSLDAGSIGATDPGELEALFRQPPAIHRFPGAMAKRVQALCALVADEYDGDAANVWKGVESGKELYARLRKLPGYGEEKSKIFVAILGKRLGIRPDGWEEAAAPFSDAERRSVADADTPEHLLEVRAWKKMMKAQKKSKTDTP